MYTCSRPLSRQQPHQFPPSRAPGSKSESIVCRSLSTGTQRERERERGRGGERQRKRERECGHEVKGVLSGQCIEEYVRTYIVIIGMTIGAQWVCVLSFVVFIFFVFTLSLSLSLCHTLCLSLSHCLCLSLSLSCLCPSCAQTTAFGSTLCRNKTHGLEKHYQS